MPGTAEDRHAADGAELRDATAGGGVDEFSDPNDHMAARIGVHPVLGTLAPVPMVTFTFDGELVEGRTGEPIAAALIAAGYRVFRTMPRFGDARGGYCMVGRCADCLVVVDGVPNVLACVTPVTAGLDVRTQHGLGERDVDSATVSEP